MTALVSTEAFAEYVGTAHDPSDVQVIRALEIASELVRAEVRQTVDAVTEEAWTTDGTGSDAIVLPQLPVTEVVTVEVDGEEVTDWTLSGAGVLIRDDGYWPHGRQNVVITYSHGYDVVPEGLQTLVLLVADRIYRTAGASGETESETIGSYSYTRSTTPEAGEGLTTDERALAAKYRVVLFA